MPFKDFSYLELWRPICSAEGNHLCNFGRGYQEEQFCEIILSLEEMSFIYFLSGALFSGTICAILVEGIMGNNSVNLFRIWASGSGDVV